VVRTRGWLARAAAAVLAAAVAPHAAAHVVHGTTTLSRLVAESDLVVRVRVVEAQEGPLLLPGPAPGRPVVRAEVVETLKGVAPEPAPAGGRASVRFAQHGHGVADYAAGDDVIVCLRAIERSRELDELAASGLHFVSLQEHDENLAVTGAAGEALLAAVRAYAGLGAAGAPAERLAALRALTLELVGSPVPRLATSATRDLALLGDDLPLGPADARRLAAIADDPAAPLAVRIGLLAELERRRLVDAPPRWAALVREARGAERVPAVHAAGAHPSAAVRDALVAVLRGDDPFAAEAAAVALGSPGNDAAVAALAQALAGGPPRLRGTAIRGLAGIGTPPARAALAQAAADHPDPDTRRRAAAELVLPRAEARSPAEAPPPR
jgi:hypothetical protein